jgi:hypothetical protein
MYKLKKIGKVFTSKFVETGHSSYEKKKLPSRGVTKVEKHCCKLYPMKPKRDISLKYTDTQRNVTAGA